jgi:hypothetical protein
VVTWFLTSCGLVLIYLYLFNDASSVTQIIYCTSNGEIKVNDELERM